MSFTEDGVKINRKRGAFISLLLFGAAEFVLSVLFTALPSVAMAENPPSLAWQSTYDGGSGDYAFAFTVDKDGNSYIAGESAGRDTVVKFNKSSNRLWSVSYGTGYGQFRAIVTDDSGNIYAAGYDKRGVAVIVKYDSSGNELWNKQHDEATVARAVVVDSAENVYMLAMNHGNGVYYLVKYDPAGNQLWSAKFASRAVYADIHTTHSLRPIVFDGDGNIVVAVSTFNGVTHDYLTIKFNSDGNEMWRALYDGGSLDYANSLTVDDVGNIYVTGASAGSGVIYDIATVKYDFNGNQLWVARYDNGGDERANNLAVDNIGNVYVVGSHIIKYNQNGEQIWVGSSGGFDIFIDRQDNIDVATFGTVTKYDSNGNNLWIVGAPGFIAGFHIDNFGNLYFGGYNDSSDLFVAKYSQIPSPIILLPGILGSWTNNFFEPFVNPNPLNQNSLSLTEESQSQFFKQLDALGYLPHTWEFMKNILPAQGFKVVKCSYDWRLKNEDITKDYLIPCIDQAKQIAGTDKVNIVAHSMGGLAVRSYIQNAALYRNDVDKLAMVGTPNHGSPEAYDVWEGGDLTRGLFGNLGGVIEKAIVSRVFNAGQRFVGATIATNYVHSFFPSVQQLLPTFDYLKDMFGNFMPAPGMVWQNNFLQGLNVTNVDKLTSPVTAKVFAGEGYQTLEQISVVYPALINPLGTSWLPYPDGEPIFSGETKSLLGDGTVLSQKSAWITEINAPFMTKTGVATDPLLEHTNLPNGFFSEVSEFLGGGATTTPIYTPRSPSSVLAVSLASPADLLITDPRGRRLGFDANTQSEVYEVPEGIYSGHDDMEIAAIMNPIPGDYKVVVQGNGAGAFHTGISYAAAECSNATVQDNAGDTQAGGVNVFTIRLAGGCTKAADYYLNAIVNVEPKTLNLKSQGSYIEAEVVLPLNYDVKNIDVNTVKLNDAVFALPLSAKIETDHGIKKLEIKFRRSEVQKLLIVGDNTVMIAGKLFNGTMFGGEGGIVGVLKDEKDKDKK
ncbi:SBBP repeat-containing protein [Candidatus Peregrinibacteria bacterium]|nr:SBBP repeat-containing protein [Candidatus Peregrinibacteria bacterium]